MVLKGVNWWLLVLVCLTSASCVEPVEVKVNSNLNLLVVDGLITNMPGPYLVKLSRTAAYAKNVSGENLPVKGAKIIISDIKTGAKEALTEILPGTYTTNKNGIQGIVGHTYVIDIETPDKKKYRSKPEILPDVAPINAIYSEFIDGNTGKEEGFYIYVDTKGTAGKIEYYKWRYTHYDFIEYCSVPDPAVLRQNCCTECWNIYDCGNCNVIGSDEISKDKGVTKQLITIVPYTFTKTYYLDIQQFSLSKEAFDYWEQLDKQSRNSGSSFDSPVSPVIGNIISLDDSKEEALGFFGASAVVIKGAGIKRNTLQPKLPKSQMGEFPGRVLLGPPPPCLPCEESATRTAKMPKDWIWG